ncbi:MAG: type II toxin-antitoxin system RelE/ParE family toxin [Tepidisphaerales bacterium]
MTVVMLEPAEADLAAAFDYYEQARPGLGHEFVDEFRRAVDRILTYPGGWHSLDATYRRCLLHRFPYAIIYRVAEVEKEIVIAAVFHTSREPDSWRSRR